jgi:hypothetical protein
VYWLVTYWAFPRAESAIAFSWLHPEAAKEMNQVNPVILSKDLKT